jgi:hypothetical protein
MSKISDMMNVCGVRIVGLKWLSKFSALQYIFGTSVSLGFAIAFTDSFHHTNIIEDMDMKSQYFQL